MLAVFPKLTMFPALSENRLLRYWRLDRTERFAEIITLAATIVFAFTGSRVAIDVFRSGSVEGHLASALLLNIALIFFSWSRHRAARTAALGRNEIESRIDVLEKYDTDTQLLNRRALFRCGGQMVESADDQNNIALMVINIKRFNRINELYGHSAGDKMLLYIAECILRVSDKKTVCARLGGDEFAILMPFAEDSLSEVEAFADRIVADLKRPFHIHGTPVGLVPSIGVSKLDVQCVDFSTLLKRADIAMNHARADGELLAWFDGKMDRTFRTRCDIEVGLRKGIPRGECIPYYQPQVDPKTHRIVGFEMLARWEYEPGRIMEPEHFITVAEDFDLINALSESVIRQALEDAKDWGPDIDLSVNISPKQLHDRQFPQTIMGLLDTSGFPPERLDIEITESSLYENLALAQSVVAQLKDKGIKLSLDDFGTGYSSLANLRSLPFDRIKIDRSFCLSMNKDPESWNMLKAVTNLAEGLGLPVTIEGVESAAIDLRLRDVRYDRAQGWFFGKPVSADDTLTLLRNSGHKVPALMIADPAVQALRVGGFTTAHPSKVH